MEGDDFAARRAMEGIDAFVTQGWMFAAEPEKIAREAMLIGHRFVLSFQTGPPDEEVGGVGIVFPEFVLKKFLAHEEHGNAGSGQEQASGDTRAAAGEPGAMI